VSKSLSREKDRSLEKKNTKKRLTPTPKADSILQMIHYYIQRNGNSTFFMVSADTEQEATGELWSLQNKGIATKADQVDDRSFLFCCSPSKLRKAFVRQFIQKHWLDSEMCELYKGEKGGFYADAKKFASEKFAKMRHADWLHAQKRVPHLYGQGQISAEKDSGNWNDVLTSVLQSA